VDALTFLRGQHKSVLGMLEVLEGAPTGEGAHTSGLETMVENLVIAESRHEAIEQQWFWPAVRKALDEGDQLADHATTQEDEGKKLLQRLEDGRPGEADYHDALAKFVKAAREHIEFEQTTVWPQFERAVDQQELESLGQTLEQAWEIAPTRPHPDTPSNPMVQKTMGAAAATVDRLRDAATGRAAYVPPDPPTP
jgi:hemerythrin-like domain-containing protein